MPTQMLPALVVANTVPRNVDVLVVGLSESGTRGCPRESPMRSPSATACPSARWQRHWEPSRAPTPNEPSRQPATDHALWSSGWAPRAER